MLLRFELVALSLQRFDGDGDGQDHENSEQGDQQSLAVRQRSPMSAEQSLKPYQPPENAKPETNEIASELCRVFPRIPRSVYHLTETWIRRHYVVNQRNTPLLHFDHQQVGLWLLDLQYRIQTMSFSQLMVDEMFTSLWDLYVFNGEKSSETAYQYAKIFKTISVLLSEFVVQVAFLNESPPTDFQRISQKLLEKVRARRKEKFIPDTKICPCVDDFTQERLLGAGGFGIVYKAKYNPAEMMCVLKLVPISSFSYLRHSSIDRVVGAVTDHPLVVSYLCCFETTDMAIAVMEYVRGVTLENVVNANRQLPPILSRMFFGQIVAGLMHFHYNGLIYRDLKPSNVMVLHDGKIKILDFETSRICRGHFPSNRITQFFKNTPWEFDDGEKAGTPPFQAPEVIEQKAYGRAADWWSAGIVLFKMHTGTLPYRSDDLQDLENLILTRPVTFPKLSKGVKLNKQESFWRDTNLLTATIYELLEKDPSQRLGSNDYNAILANPFVAEVSWDAPYSSHAMIANVFEQKMTRNKHGEYSINGNRDLKKQQLLGLSALRERGNIDLPLSTYVSKFYRKLYEGRASPHHWRASRNPILKEITNTKAIFAEVEGVETTQEMEKLEIAVAKGVGFAAVSPMGVKIASTMGENQNYYFFVRKLTGSAANSGLVLGDIILEVNGVSVVNDSRMELERKLMFCSDMVFLTVMTSSPFRLCKTRRDMSSVANLYPQKTATLPAFEEGFINRVLPSKKIQVRPCGFYNEHKNIFVQLFCIWLVDQTFVEDVYFGDFLLSIDGQSVSEMTEKDVNGLLNDHSRERTITFIPMSSLRKKRPYFDRSLRIFAKPESTAQEDNAAMLGQLNQEYVTGDRTESTGSYV